jgi:enoyl-CoA hydratase/carnithine racemase
MQLERAGAVFILQLDDGENRFNSTWRAEYSALLDEVDAATGPRALVTAGTGKFWSNGLDLDWMTAHPNELPEFIEGVHALLGRVLSAGYPTIAAIQGHAFAAGAMLAVAHDLRYMREDRGFICLPEIDIRMAFTPGMNALLSAKLTPQTAQLAMVWGTRFGGGAALEAGIVDAVASESELLERAVERAESLAGKDPVTLSAIKRSLYAPALAALDDRAANGVLQGFPGA